MQREALWSACGKAVFGRDTAFRRQSGSPGHRYGTRRPLNHDRGPDPERESEEQEEGGTPLHGRILP